MKSIILAISSISYLVACPVFAAPVSADFFDTSSGTLNGFDFSLSGFNSGSTSQSGVDALAGSSFIAAPLPGRVEVINHPANSEWTITFEQPVRDLRLYLDGWRGPSAGGPIPVTYAFTEDFSILSQNGTFNEPSPGTLTILQSTFGEAILEFDGLITMLSVTTSAEFGNGQLITFGIDDSQVPNEVPLPSGLALLFTGVAGIIFMKRRGGARNSAAF